MSDFDLTVRGGTLVTAADKMVCDIGVRNGKIVCLEQGLEPAEVDFDATDKLVLPGGIEAHCHIEQKSSFGIMTADDFYSGTVAAAFGGNTTVIPFAAQHRGTGLRETVEDYQARAQEKSVIDYSYHLIISEPTENVLGQELPALIREGITSFKIYMTYDLLRLDDGQILDVLATARREGALVMVHAENHEMIRWLSDRLMGQGHTAPKFHAISHSRMSEAEATHRAIALASLVDTPLLIVHVSTEEAAIEIRRAQDAGLKIFAETCPQYICLTAQDLDRQGIEGAKFCCSPPPRDETAQQAMWTGLANGTFQIFSSDHAPYRFDESAKLRDGADTPFTRIANGVPGIELRLPLLYSEGVRKGRIDLHQFVALTSTNAAKIYGLFPRKGTLGIGADADIAIWDPELEKTITWEDLHDQAGYTPYEGRTLRGWPVTVINQGRVVIDCGELRAERGSGGFIARERPSSAHPLNRLQPEVDPTRNFGADLL